MRKMVLLQKLLLLAAIGPRILLHRILFQKVSVLPVVQQTIIGYMFTMKLGRWRSMVASQQLKYALLTLVQQNIRQEISVPLMKTMMMFLRNQNLAILVAALMGNAIVTMR